VGRGLKKAIGIALLITAGGVAAAWCASETVVKVDEGKQLRQEQVKQLKRIADALEKIANKK
jgi:hypothetical protein